MKTEQQIPTPPDTPAQERPRSDRSQSPSPSSRAPQSSRQNTPHNQQQQQQQQQQEHPLDLNTLIKAGTIVLQRCSIDAEFVAMACRFGVEFVMVEPREIAQEGDRFPDREGVPSYTRALQRMHDAKLIRCAISVRGVRNAIAGDLFVNAFVLRVYLVPSDDERAPEQGRVGIEIVFSVLSLVRLDEDEWDSGVVADNSALLLDEDQRTLLDVYRAVDSPNPSDAAKAQVRATLYAEPKALLRTELYAYQLDSVAQMLTKETHPCETPSPSYQRLRSVDDSESYWISYEGSVCRRTPLVREPRGGIVGEEMGSGKTLEVLSLIALTLNKMPSLEGVSPFLDGSDGDQPHLLTQLSRKWPFPKAREEADRARRKVRQPLEGTEDVISEAERRKYAAAKEREEADLARAKKWTLPSLKDVALDLVKTIGIGHASARSINKWNERKMATLRKSLANVVPSYFVHPSDAQLDGRASRAERFIPSQEIVACAATLIVVPSHLVQHWLNEVNKHFAPGALKVIAVTKAATITVELFAAHDAVLVSKEVFRAATKPSGAVLRRLHLKRLVVDEGDVLGKANSTSEYSNELRCECRWAVSGTPTSSLRSAHDSDESLPGSVSGSSNDFERLGQLVCKFLKHPAFPELAVWRLTVKSPIRRHNRGASRLLGVFNSVFIKNQPHKLVTEHAIKRETVFFEMEPGAERKTYNALLALFTVNAVETQREGRQYLFHPKNAKDCEQLATNLSASSFFFTSTDIVDQLEFAIGEAKRHLNAQSSAVWSENERASVEAAIVVMKEALNDTEWKHIARSSEQSIQVEVTGLDRSLLKALDGLSAEKNRSGGRRDLVSLRALATLCAIVHELRKPSEEGEPKWTDGEDFLDEVKTLLAKGAHSKHRSAKDINDEHSLALPADRSLKQIKVGKTTSAKLNWLIDEVRAHPNDKFIVFSSFHAEFVFSMISEAFDVRGIKHVVYLSSTSADVPVFFNNSSVKDCQVILINAKLKDRGLYGLDLVAACREIRLEPIWEADLSVQAEKRASRLGQKKDVIQKTLVVRGSWEDEVRKRRVEMGANEVASQKAPQKDEKLGAVLRGANWAKPAPARNEAQEEEVGWALFPGTRVDERKKRSADEAQLSANSAAPKKQK